MLELSNDIIPVGYDEGRAYLAIFLSWFIAQATKVITGVFREKRLNFRYFVRTGGMPSSHSSVASATAMITGYYFGFTSIPFVIVLVFAMITMFDAAGVRRAAGKQASILNKMIDDIYEHGAVHEGRLKELLGHTPIEVLAGLILGVLTVVLLH